MRSLSVHDGRARASTCLFCLMTWCVAVTATAADRDAPPPPPPMGPSIVGIDHLPTVVRDLAAASDAYRALGFVLKPGRAHADGLRNAHVKFVDGSGIELISPTRPSTDALSAQYLDHLAQGDGPAYLALHARDQASLKAGLRDAGFTLRDDGTLDDPALGFLFFLQDNRSPTDRPGHFAHPNSATAMSGVWLALDAAARARLSRLLVALGAVHSRETVRVPDPVAAEVLAVQNGRIVLLPAGRRLVRGRPIVGVEFRVRDRVAADRFLAPRARVRAGREASGEAFVAPRRAHGLWLAFRTAR